LYWPQGWEKDTIKFGKPICDPWAQCSSIYWPCLPRQGYLLCLDSL
jgi:hypothetical protein